MASPPTFSVQLMNSMTGFMESILGTLLCFSQVKIVAY